MLSNPPKQTCASIFNDVIGPVMRGPSSSHCAASVRIGKLARDLMDGEIESVLVEFDPGGSLATTHESQGSDIGLFGGLLGWEATDARLGASPKAIREAGIDVRIEIREYGDTHPNTYRITLRNAREEHRLIALSTGGGMIQVIEVDGAKIQIAGDFFETLLYLPSGGDDAVEYLSKGLDLSKRLEVDAIHAFQAASGQIVQVKSQHFPDEELISELKALYEVQSVKKLSPVMPVLSRAQIQVPFITLPEMLAYNQTRGLSLGELAAHYESARGNLSKELVFERMQEIVHLMQRSIQEALEGTHYHDRILGYQSGAYRQAMENRDVLEAGMLNRIILYTTAMMEQKSAMGVIVAAPTAGACGGLPGAVIGAASEMGLSMQVMTRAMLAAGMVGVFIAQQASFAAEVLGCQAECGAATTMAAAALVELAGGNAEQSLGAASMALQNVLGLICDPVANRVEVPCLGRNVMAASNALACANMSLAGFDAVIPLNEVIDAMYSVGVSIPCELRCTGLGGLSVTPTSRKIENGLNR